MQKEETDHSILLENLESNAPIRDPNTLIPLKQIALVSN